jgi:hypothetical protein
MSGRKDAGSANGRPAASLNRNGHGGRGAAFSESRIAARVAALGKQISKAYKGRRLDIVVTLDRGFVFAADLIRRLDGTVVCHFVHEDVRDIDDKGRARREVFFGKRPSLKGRDVLLVDAILESGFRTASKEVWVGYGLAAANGTGRNLRQLASGAKAAGKSERRKK